MLLPKINSKFFPALFIIFSNFWIYKIFSLNIVAGAILSLSSLAIFFYPRKKMIFFSMAILAFMQFQTTSIKSLILLDNDEQRVQSERIRSYPPTYIDLGVKVIWLKPETWIERNNLVIALSRLEENLFFNLDLNRYFFGGFPRNKPEDFEKFPYVYLPFFVTGVFVLLKKKKFGDLVLLLGLSILLLAYLGNENKLGPVILFPFIAYSISKGMIFMEEFFKNKQLFYAIVVVSVLLTLVMQVSYGKN